MIIPQFLSRGPSYRPHNAIIIFRLQLFPRSVMAALLKTTFRLWSVLITTIGDKAVKQEVTSWGEEMLQRLSRYRMFHKKELPQSFRIYCL